MQDKESDGNIHRLRPPKLKASGVSRVADNDKAVLVSFSRRLTDEEMRFFHEVCERSAPLMEIKLDD